jgi:glucose/arabinose dehydrogenase
MAATLAVGAPAYAEPPSATVAPVVGALNAPRGVAFDRQGSLYVAESGRWQGSFVGGKPTGEGVTDTGAVSKYRDATTTPGLVWRTPLTSRFDSANGPEVLGPEGLAATGGGCASKRGRERRGCGVLAIMSESRAGVAATHPGATVPEQLGQLLRLDGGTGAIRDTVSNVGDQQYAWTAQHPELDPGGQFPDANPYAVLVTRRHTYVADAGANTISQIEKDGTTRVIAYIPNDPVSDATPTCIAQGPDGALYVGALDFLLNSDLSTIPPGIGLKPGHSDVWRINPNTHEDLLHAAHLWATGLTTVTACTFDSSGNFWAAEMFQPNGNAAPGDLVRIPFGQPTTLDRVGGGRLPLPGGVAEGPDGDLYVTIGSADVTPNAGAVVRVDVDD